MRRKFYTVLEAGEKSLRVVPENTRLLTLQASDAKPPFFMIDSFPYFIDVIRLFDRKQPVMSLIGHEDMLMAGHYSIEAEAARHVQTMLQYYPNESYMLGGCSASGIVAYEIARQLRALGRQVGLLVLFDTANTHYMREYSRVWMSLASYRNDLHRLRCREVPRWIVMKWRNLMLKVANRLKEGSARANGTKHELGPSDIRIQAARKYKPAPFVGRVLLFKRHRLLTGRYRDPHYGWGSLISGELEVCEVNATEHVEIFKSELDRTIVAGKLREQFNRALLGSTALSASGEKSTKDVDSSVYNGLLTIQRKLQG